MCIRLSLALVMVMALVGAAQGNTYLDGLAGFARLSLDTGNSHGDIDDLDGWGMGFRIGLGGADAGDGPRVFFNFHGTNYYGDEDEDPIWNVALFTPELGVAWHLSLGESGFFVEPCVSGGAAIASYTRRGDFLVSYIVGEDEVAAGWVVRPGVLLGYQGDAWGLGVELSYGSMNIDLADEVNFVFDGDLFSSPEVNGTHSEMFLGLFARFSW